MNIPLKPWEVSMNGVSPSANNLYMSNNTDRLHSSAIPYPGSGGGSIAAMHPSTSTLPPTVPPRPAQTRQIYSAYNRNSMMPYGNSPYSSYGTYSSQFGGMNSPYYSPYTSSYNSYGMGGLYSNRGYGSPSLPYGPPGLGEPTFSQVAEESASSAFQSIESFVSAFSSISAMMDSTFHALYSSFRAVIGVADHLGRVKQIVSALAIFRFFKWVYRRFLYLVGISKIKPADVESLWNNLSENDQLDPGDLLRPHINKPSSWPIVMFLGFIFAGPYLMWKLIKSLNLDPSSQKLVDNCKWATGASEHFVATAEYSFDPINDRELTLKSGQTIRLAPAKFQPPEVKGWVLASDGVKIGLVPTNYIKILGKKTNENNLQPPPPTPVSFQTVPAPPESSLKQQKSHLSFLNSETDNNAQFDSSGMSSDDDSETLVGEPLED